jgi:hypothetical protein
MNTSKRSFEGSPDIQPEISTSSGRLRSGLILTFLGLLVFLIGARPALFGLDRSPVVGFIQIAVFLVGLAMICLGGYISLNTYWRNGDKTIVADIGLRLVSTGYVIAAFAGMADVFGFGGQPWPNVPFFGIWQATGVEIGQIVIAIGFLMMLPFRRNRRARIQE